MGRRSRKRSITAPAPLPAAPPPAASAAPAARRRRARIDERPPAPWGGFPLGELTTLAGIVALGVGFGTGRYRLLAVGLALVALAAMELSLREHLAGFRSHSSLLGLVAGAVTAAVLVAVQAPRGLQVGLAAAAFAAAFLLARRAFARRTGGMGFRA